MDLNNTHFSHNFITVIKIKNDEVCGKCMLGGGGEDDKCVNSSFGIAVRKRPPGDLCGRMLVDWLIL
jgi:hypothetical protein